MDIEKIKYWEKVVNSGEIYNCLDEELLAYQRELVNKLRKYNLTEETDNGLKERENILKDICGTYGENLCILPPIYANWGLKHVHFGKNVFINFNATIVDDANVFIDDYVMIGTSVNIATAIHPVSPVLRKYQLQYNKPVHIKKNVWIGSGATILPGVTVGENSIIGAMSVVTKDIPDNVIAFGNPARVVRKINDDDYIYFDGKKIPKDILDKFK